VNAFGRKTQNPTAVNKIIIEINCQEALYVNINEAMAGNEQPDMRRSAKPLMAAVIKHIRENVDLDGPMNFSLGEAAQDRWSYAPGQLKLLREAKQKAAF